MIDLIKPKYGSPCNGCGMCCKIEVCKIGTSVFGDDVKAPCPALVDDGKRYFCAVVLAEEHSEMRHTPHIYNELGIGKGCCASDFIVEEE